jgi:hypothetical protein
LYVSLALLFGHLLIPFFGLMPRRVKRTPWILACWAVWLLIFHWIDLYYIVMPTLGSETSAFGIVSGIVDFGILLGVLCLYLAGIAHVAGDRALVPQKDPRLSESLAFENV